MVLTKETLNLGERTGKCDRTLTHRGYGVCNMVVKICEKSPFISIPFDFLKEL